MNNFFSGFVEKVGSNFLISAMIPSLGLVIAIFTVFDPILGLASKFQNPNGIYQFVNIGLLILVPTVIIGFTLTAMNTFILKILEGYVFLHHFSSLKERQRKKAQRLLLRKETLERRMSVLESWKDKTPRLHKVLARVKNAHYLVSTHYDKNFPPNLDQVLPTEFGNILKASEAYPGDRYGIDGVEFWPRLIHVIPKDYQESIDGSHNELSFLVNMGILALAFSFLCLLAIFYNFISQSFSPSLSGLTLLQNAGRYTLSGVIALAFVFFFHKASIISVSTFGVMIRSAYDLFRLDLLKRFRLKMPKNSDDEFFMWKNLGELIALGQHSLSFEPLEYQMDEPKQLGKD